MSKYTKYHVFSDRQHYGKPRKPGDRGASFDIDGSGTVEFDEMEANLTPFIIEGRHKFLEQNGVTTEVIQSGSYPSRHGKANDFARRNPDTFVVYIADHLNRVRVPNTASYYSGFYDHRSRNGDHLSKNIAASVELAELPGISRVISRDAEPHGSWVNAFYTIKGIFSGPANICGYCSEPLFMDHEDHRIHLSTDGLRNIGRIQAEGILSFFRGL